LSYGSGSIVISDKLIISNNTCVETTEGRILQQLVDIPVNYCSIIRRRRPGLSQISAWQERDWGRQKWIWHSLPG